MAEANSMIRVGVVSDVDEVKRRVRVFFPDLSSMVSDWLFVPQRPFHGDPDHAPFTVYTEEAGEDAHTHAIEYADGTWLPKVNETVLVIYTPGFSTDGYVLGVIP